MLTAGSTPTRHQGVVEMGLSGKELAPAMHVPAQWYVEGRLVRAAPYGTSTSLSGGLPNLHHRRCH